MKKKWIEPEMGFSHFKKIVLVMRLTFFLIVVSVLSSSAVSFGQKAKLDLNFKDRQIREILSQIEDQSDYSFMYDNNQVDVAKKVSLDAKDSSIEEIMNELFKGTDVTYKIIDRHIMLFPEASENAGQQEKTITGKVTDATGLPLPGVTVVVKGTTNGTITAFDGIYSLSNIPGDAVLIFSFVGMKSQEIAISGKSQINIKMEEETIGLEEVVAIGYGTVRKSDITGSLTSVSSDELAKNPVSQIGQALAGKVSGVFVQQTSGIPGATPTIRIRGGNSINGDNSPLFVVDGFISAIGAQNINPEDIKSLEILKDASATAIYGSRGANGVILITTKGGKIGEKVSVNLKSYAGAQQIIKKIDMMDASQHASYLNSYAQYKGLSPYIPDLNSIQYNTDWQDAMLQTALQNSHFLSVSGGSEKMEFNTSLDYFNQDGIVRNSGYERLNAKVKLDIKFNDHIKSGINVSFRNAKAKNVANVFKSILDLSPTLPVYNPDGSYNYLLSYDTPGVESSNPIEELYEYTNFSVQKVIGLQGYVDFELYRDLYFKTEISYNWTDRKIHKFIPSTTFSGNQNLSTASLQSVQRQSIETINTIRYDHYLNTIHHINLVAGISTINENESMFSARAKDVGSDVLKYYDLASGDPTQNSVNSDYVDARQLSLLGRLNYGFRDKYLFTLSGRYDGSSNFGANNRFVFFPSGAFAWRLSEEEFIKKLNFFDNAKVRLTYGLTGNQAISPYQTLSLLNPSKFPLGNQLSVGYMPIRIANPDLKWETTKQFDGGIDLGFFSNKLQFTLDFYLKTTRDLLLDKSIPSTTGFSSMIDNIGSIENKGFEFDTKILALNKKNLTWNIDFNFSLNRNKIIDLGDVNRIFPDDSKVSNAKTDRTNILQVGQSVGAFYTYVFDGIFQTQEEIDAYPHISDTKPGGVKVRDIDGDEIISEADKIITGNAQPDFFFGITNELTLFKSFDISMLWQGAVGGEILNYDRYLFTLNASNVPTHMKNYWTQNNKNTDIPAPGYSGILTDNYIEDGTYLRLKNLSLSYRLPKILLSKSKISTASVFITGYDLITITNYSGINPEVNYFGDSNAVLNADFNSYPTTKSYSIGINLKF